MRRILYVFVLLLILSGCAPLGQAPLIKSAVPPEQPLVPVAIYVPNCEHESSHGLFAIMGAADRALGEGICAALWPAAIARFSSDRSHFIVLHSRKISEGAGPFEIQPDLVSEKAIEAKYRIVLGRPASFRRMESIGGGGGAPAQGTREWVEASMSFSVIDIATGKTLDYVALKPEGSGLRGAENIVDRLARGLSGPRCPSYYFNNLSFKSALQKVPVCYTFALPAPQVSE